MITIVPATAEHIKALYGELPGNTVRAIAIMNGDRVIGIGGTYLDQDNTVLFSKATEELRANKRAVVKAYRTVMNGITGRVFAICDSSIPKAREFLEHLGFEKINSEVYTWKR